MRRNALFLYPLANLRFVTLFLTANAPHWLDSRNKTREIQHLTLLSRKRSKEGTAPCHSCCHQHPM
ncbi:uncharacterized protein BYT42DRAFT_568956 [Radiomyces spectabilis]|uniref:uncharacterized protein n=1 Tax=Radiomyces spectabilis TaxID=64574 RepID=UPI00221F11C8|nr:uncharacterized protein BYT42DRAFT_568956 [Radiomyces spectabilis]KAI8379483.1 hypothetical protein BYT42DRAFT_568956 [Radiomyces spectabilis]